MKKRDELESYTADYVEVYDKYQVEGVLDEYEEQINGLEQRNKELEEKLDSALQDAQEWKETSEQNHEAYVQYYHLTETLEARIRELEEIIEAYKEAERNNI